MHVRGLFPLPIDTCIIRSTFDVLIPRTLRPAKSRVAAVVSAIKNKACNRPPSLAQEHCGATWKGYATLSRHGECYYLFFCFDERCFSLKTLFITSRASTGRTARWHFSRRLPSLSHLFIAASGVRIPHHASMRQSTQGARRGNTVR